MEIGLSIAGILAVGIIGAIFLLIIGFLIGAFVLYKTSELMGHKRSLTLALVVWLLLFIFNLALSWIPYVGWALALIIGIIILMLAYDMKGIEGIVKAIVLWILVSIIVTVILIALIFLLFVSLIAILISWMFTIVILVILFVVFIVIVWYFYSRTKKEGGLKRASRETRRIGKKSTKRSSYVKSKNRR